MRLSYVQEGGGSPLDGGEEVGEGWVLTRERDGGMRGGSPFEGGVEVEEGWVTIRGMRGGRNGEGHH